MYRRTDQDEVAAASRNSIVPFELLRPRNTDRAVAFITVNGNPSGHNAFVAGVDIRLPENDVAPCGAFCGLHKLRRAADRPQYHQLLIKTVRRLSPWMEGRPISAPRRFRLMWAGSGKRGGPRGDLLRHHQARRDWLLHDTRNEDATTTPEFPNASASGRVDLVRRQRRAPHAHPHAPHTSCTRVHPAQRVAHWMPRAMSESDFCYSPLGQNDGDSDRYLPAVLYGCVPVFATAGEALPLEEAIDWKDAALRVFLARLAVNASRLLIPLPVRPQLSARDIPKLPEILGAINASRLLRMRRALQRVWPALLWPFFDRFNMTKLRPRGNARPRQARHGAYKRSDAFSNLMTVLRRRLGAHGCVVRVRTHSGQRTSLQPRVT
jgi:hypothetical protein